MAGSTTTMFEQFETQRLGFFARHGFPAESRRAGDAQGRATCLTVGGEGSPGRVRVHGGPAPTVFGSGSGWRRRWPDASFRPIPDAGHAPGSTSHTSSQTSSTNTSTRCPSRSAPM